MEQGAAKIAKLLLVAILLGVSVTAFNPSYRQAFLALTRGEPQENPIWQSNLEYYPDIVLPGMPPWKPAPPVDERNISAAAREAAAQP